MQKGRSSNASAASGRPTARQPEIGMAGIWLMRAGIAAGLAAADGCKLLPYPMLALMCWMELQSATAAPLP